MAKRSAVINADEHDLQHTRQRLLEAAGEVFADRGYKNATVREICRRAGANIAAVNYHFGDKQQLYSAALNFAHACVKQFPLDAGLDESSSPEQRLHAFISGFLRGILAEGRPAWHGRLMAREMNEPTKVLDEIVANSIRPRFELLSSILRGLLGNDAPPELIQRCAQSIVGQMLFYHFAAPVLKRLFPRDARRAAPASSLSALADHINAFSLAGIRGAQASATSAAGGGA
jgi:AcrR family transcriptional regulator